MADARKQGFYTVEADVEEMQKKIRWHRKKIAIFIAVAVVFAAVFVVTAGVYFTFREYREYEVLSEIERSDSEATKYESFSGKILRYNNDGAFYTDAADNLIWNQAFEMQNPFADISGSYAVLADMQGSQIYIMDTQGIQGEVSANHPIQSICVAEQGTIAVLTQAEGTSYIELYSKSGESLAAGEIHVANSGYPLDIALSSDANKLAVSILDVSKGKAKTTIAFYNFGAAGQNEIDNMVGSYSYDNAIIPEIGFISNDRLIAFGDGQTVFFDGRQSPQQTMVLELEKEVKSIFYDSSYFGFVYTDESIKNGHKMEIYDMEGKLRLEQEFVMAYQDIGFLENHEICIRDAYACEIYTLRGVKKFTYKFDDALYGVFSDGMNRRYTFILDGIMKKVKLK